MGLFTLEYSSTSTIEDILVADNVTIVKYANDTFLTYLRPYAIGASATRTKSGKIS